VKDEYNLEFLELTEKHNEKELELAIMQNIRHFLSEMRGDFAFIGNQFKLEVGSENFYIDVLSERTKGSLAEGPISDLSGRRTTFSKQAVFRTFPPEAESIGGAGIEDRVFQTGICGQDELLPDGIERKGENGG